MTDPDELTPWSLPDLHLPESEDPYVRGCEAWERTPAAADYSRLWTAKLAAGDCGTPMDPAEQAQLDELNAAKDAYAVLFVARATSAQESEKGKEEPTA